MEIAVNSPDSAKSRRPAEHSSFQRFSFQHFSSTQTPPFPRNPFFPAFGPVTSSFRGLPQKANSLQSFPLQNRGAIVKSLETSGSAVISAASGSLYSGFSGVYVVVRNLDVRTYDNPRIGGIDLNYAAQCRLENVVVSTDVYNVQASQPTHATTGLVTPANNNGALTVLRNVLVSGYDTGILVREHTDADHIVVASNIHGIKFSFAHHASRFGRIGTYRNTHHVTVAGKHGFSIGQMNTEQPGAGQTNAHNAWQTLLSDLNDPNNLGTGDINYWVVIGGVGAVDTFTKNGGTGIRARRIGSLPGGSN